MKPDHPDMLSLRAADRRAQQADRRGIARQMSSGPQQYAARRISRGACRPSTALQARVNQLKGAVLNLRGRSIQYNILQREVDTNRSLYDALLQRYKEIGVAGGIGMAPVSIVDRADAPTLPFKPNLLMNLLFGLGLGLLAGIGAAHRSRVPQRHDQDPRGRPQEARAAVPRRRCPRPRPRTPSSRI